MLLFFTGYDYSARYPGSDYMRSAGDYYSMGGFAERGQAANAGYAAAAGYGAYRYPGYVYTFRSLCLCLWQVEGWTLY